METSPSRIAALTSKIVSMVASPLRKAADNLANISSNEEGEDGMLVDEEISIRGRNLSAGLVRVSHKDDEDIRNDIVEVEEQFFSAQNSLEPMAPVVNNVSQESVPIMSRSFSTENEQKATDMIIPPLSPQSVKKYSEREVTALMVRREGEGEERANRQLEFLQYEINILQEKYAASLVAGEEMRSLLSEYEKSMASIVEARQRVGGDAGSMGQGEQQLQVDLQAMHIAFANLKQRYDEQKNINEQLRSHEQVLKGNISALQTDLSSADQRYNNLREHAESRLADANDTLHRLKSTLEIELSSTKAKLHKSELRVNSLEANVEAKTRENAELMAICDELIQKIDTQAREVGGTSRSSTLLASLNINRPSLG